jgi:glyoxylase-like metal-dependent hydrolase (beta-lactamase superfamily II)
VIAADPVAVQRIPAGPWEQSCYVVSTDAGDAVVIDPGAEADGIAERIAADRLRVHAVLATHGHHDHVGALPQLVETLDVPFGIHSLEADVLSRVNFHRFVFHELGPVSMPPIGLDLAAATALRFGSLEVAVVHTPGHTPGSVCFEVGRELFTGDTLTATGIGRTDLPGGDPEILEASVAMLCERYPPATRLRPGHGEPVTLGDALARRATAREP